IGLKPGRIVHVPDDCDPIGFMIERELTRRVRRLDSERDRLKNTRANMPDGQKAIVKAQAAIRGKLREPRSKAKTRFYAVDGERGGNNNNGQQHYFFMAAASADRREPPKTCDNDGAPLSFKDCVEFILSLPANAILVGFGFGYDSTQILRGIRKRSAMKRILYPPRGRAGQTYTFVDDYGFKYQPGKMLAVCRADRRGDWRGKKQKKLEGSERIIYETLTNFQMKFADVIDAWQTGSKEERQMIGGTKGIRDNFTELTDPIRHYCILECRHLAEAMTKFRQQCVDAGLVPNRWNGAGELAAAMLKKHGVPKRPLSLWEIETINKDHAEKNVERERNGKPPKEYSIDTSNRRAERHPEFEKPRVRLITAEGLKSRASASLRGRFTNTISVALTLRQCRNYLALHIRLGSIVRTRNDCRAASCIWRGCGFIIQ
ncbi:MAG TPA: hypothetical protein VGJ20_11070, partial [Xanthobacteraceae bacterium]